MKELIAQLVSAYRKENPTEGNSDRAFEKLKFDFREAWDKAAGTHPTSKKTAEPKVS